MSIEVSNLHPRTLAGHQRSAPATSALLIRVLMLIKITHAINMNVYTTIFHDALCKRVEFSICINDDFKILSE